MKSILLVDDHRLLLSSLVKLLKSHYDYNFVSTSSSLEAVEILKTKKFDLAILDINMPQMNGLELLEIIKRDYPATTIAMLSVEDSEKTILKAFRIGCDAYLLKDIRPEDLFTAIDSLLENGFYSSNRVSELMIRDIQSNKQNELEKNLTETEKKFIQLACSERTYKEIAETLLISPKTIEKHRQNIFNKLGVRNRVGLVIYALKNGLIEL